MVLNCYEESLLKNKKLPEPWQSQKSLKELEEFLQFHWEQRAVFYEDGAISTRQQFLHFVGQQGLRTRNYIGTIVFKGQQLNIFPKVFRLEKEDQDTEGLEGKHLMKNLVCWLEYCGKIDFPFLHIHSQLEDSQDLRELFVSLYIRYVKHALDRSLFYRYEDQTEDCGVIKGRVDVKDYYLRKLPQGQLNQFRCSYSSFQVDNGFNRILKFTCKTLLNETTPANQRLLRQILMKLSEVSDVVCTPSDCDQIRFSQLHRRYSVILSMSKLFLLNKTAAYMMDQTESFCFLFPTEVLFEGFVGGFLQEALGAEARVRLQASEQPLIDDMIYAGESYGRIFSMRHDILAQYRDALFVLDTKYKQTQRFQGNQDLRASIARDISQSDLYQISTYALKRGLHHGYLLYPMYRYEEEEPVFPALNQKIFLDGKEHIVTIHLIRLPFVFEEDEERTRKMLKATLGKIFQQRADIQKEP